VNTLQLCKRHIRLENVRKRRTEVLSHNHCYNGKAISITYSECLFLDLGIVHAMRMSHIVICGRPGCKIFSALSHKRHDYLKSS